MIRLILSTLPIDEVPGQVAIAPVFEDVRPLKGSTSLVDWRLNGRLSDLILKGRLNGEFTEFLIMPAQGRIAAREILVFGLGEKEMATEERLEAAFATLINKLNLLKSGELVVSFGDFARDFMGWRAILRNFVSTLVRRQVSVEVICAEDSKWINEAKKRNMDFGPEVTLSYA